MPDSTEITLSGGERLHVEERPEQVEAAILGAARGSIMEFAWFADAGTGQRVAVNPEYVVLLRRVADGPAAV